MTTTYMVFIAGTFDSSYDTLKEAEARIAAIASKYDFINPDSLHILENTF